MSLVRRIVLVLLVVVVIGVTVPVLWDLFQDAGDAIAGLSGGSETDILQAIWPVAMILISIGIGAGVVFYALKQFGVVGKGK